VFSTFRCRCKTLSIHASAAYARGDTAGHNRTSWPSAPVRDTRTRIQLRLRPHLHPGTEAWLRLHLGSRHTHEHPPSRVRFSYSLTLSLGQWRLVDSGPAVSDLAAQNHRARCGELAEISAGIGVIDHRIGWCSFGEPAQPEVGPGGPGSRADRLVRRPARPRHAPPPRPGQGHRRAAGRPRATIYRRFQAGHTRLPQAYRSAAAWNGHVAHVAADGNMLTAAVAVGTAGRMSVPPGWPWLARAARSRTLTRRGFQLRPAWRQPS